MKTLILDHQQIAQKIQRIAHEIYEYNFEEKELIIAGIADRGYTLAERINKELLKISPIKTLLLSLKVDKEKQTISTVKLDLNPDLLKNKVVLLVDDVLNTGRTLSYAVYPFLEH